MKRKIGKISLVTILMLIGVLLISGQVFAYQQAPELDEKVETGELEPVQERLPDEPYVTEVWDEIGDYGGTWTTLIPVPNHTKLMTAYTLSNLVRVDKKTKKIIPDMAKDYEVKNEGKTFIFHLREGMKWSDGEPFTADDIVFWYNAVIMNDHIIPENQDLVVVGGEAGSIEKIDKYTVRWELPEPNSLLLQKLASPRQGNRPTPPFLPAHYLKQFHADYTDEAKLENIVEESSYDNWYDLFEAKMDSFFLHNPDIPVMQPWVPTQEPPAQRFVFKRNPYFYKVDEEGNQLPYINNVAMRLVQDSEVVNLQTASGVPDLQQRRLGIDNYTLFKDGEKQGNYEVLLWPTASTAAPGIYPNQNANDPVLRKLNRNKKFRQALSMAIDRENINNVVYKGFGEPMQITAIPSWPNYKEEWAKAYAEQDIEAANKLLDEIGLEKDSEGNRLRSDGDKLHITILVTEQPKFVDALELVTDDWAKLGISTSIRMVERTLLNNRMQSGDAEFCVWRFDPRLVWPKDLTPISNFSRFAPEWGQWYESNGESGTEPPAHIKDLQNIYDNILKTVDQEKRLDLYSKIFEKQAENIWSIGTVGRIPQPVVRKNYFKNVPDEYLHAWAEGGYFGRTEVYQYYIEKEAQ